MTLRRLDHPLLPAALGLAWALVVVWAFTAGTGDLSLLVRASPPWSDPAATPPDLTIVERGYDGQYYYRLAHDPLTDRITEHGITLERPAYRQQRILYPSLAALVSLGDPGRIPLALVLVNVIGLAAIGLLGGALARMAGRHAVWGALFVAYPGFVATVSRDLTEVTGAVFVLGALVLLRRARDRAASVAFTLALLARETTLLIPALIGLVRAVRLRAATATWLPFALPLAVALVWQAVLIARWRAAPVAGGAAVGLDPPFLGLLAAAWLNVERFTTAQMLPWLAIIAFMLALVVIGLRARHALLPEERAAWYGYVALATILEANIWANDAPLRSLNELGMLTAVAVVSSTARLRWTLLVAELALSLMLVGLRI